LECVYGKRKRKREGEREREMARERDRETERDGELGELIYELRYMSRTHEPI